MNIFEILEKVATLVDPETVRWQSLNSGDRNISVLQKKKCGKIIFYTEEEKAQDMIRAAVKRNKFVPILLWLPKDAVDKAIETETDGAKAAEAGAEGEK